MGNPFSRPAPTSGIQWEDFLGKLLLIEPKSYEQEVNTQYGTKPAVRADVTVVDADAGPEEWPEALIFPGVLINQTRSLLGQKVLGRLGQGTPKQGQKPPWVIQDPTEEDIAIGTRYIDSRSPKVSAPAQPHPEQQESGVPF